MGSGNREGSDLPNSELAIKAERKHSITDVPAAYMSALHSVSQQFLEIALC